MRHPRFIFLRCGRSRRTAALALAMAGLTGSVATAGEVATESEIAPQGQDEPRIERRVQVIFTDDEAVTEKRVWVDDGSEGGPVVLPGDEGELLFHATPPLHPRTYLGVHLLDITPELREHFGAARETGVLVSAVAEDSPAANAGIEVGDVLTTLDGDYVAHTGKLLRRLAGRDAGDVVTVGLVRDRRSLTLEAALAERPRPQVDLAPMFWSSSDGERRVLRLPTRIIEIEEGDLDEAFSELHERLESPEWRQKLEETDSRRRTLENRIRELEERLREMEERLAEDPG